MVIDTVKGGDIKKIVDEIKKENPKVAVMLFEPKEKSIVIACGSRGNNIECNRWIEQIAAILGGKGGGRKDFASGGGKEFSKLEEAKQKALLFVKEHL